MIYAFTLIWNVKKIHIHITVYVLNNICLHFIHYYIITRDNDEEECNEEAQRDEQTEKPVCSVYNYSEVVNQIKTISSLFILQKGDVDGFNLLKTAQINLEKN